MDNLYYHTDEEPMPFNITPDPEKIRLYCEYTKGDRDASIELLLDKNTTNPTICQRLSAAFTAPDDKFVPEPNELSIMNLERGELIDKIIIAHQRATTTNSKRLIGEDIAKSIIYWMNTQKTELEEDLAWQSYQIVIAKLVPVIFETNKKLAIELLDYYTFLDYRPYRGDFNQSSYQPLINLLRNRLFQREVKDYLLEKWFGIASSEYSGNTTPRMPHEAAINWMGDYIHSVIGFDEMPDIYSLEKVVEFLESILEPDIQYVDCLPNLNKIIKTIKDKELRYKFIYRHIAKNNKLTLFNKNQLDSIKWLRKEAEKRGDKDFIQKANNLISAEISSDKKRKDYSKIDNEKKNDLLKAIRS